MGKYILLVALLLIPLVYAMTECGRFTNVADIPCNIISSYNNSGNCLVNGSIYNESGVIIQDLYWGNYTPTCAAEFNISDIGTYQYTGIEDGIITVEGDAKLIAAIIILIPLIMAIVLIIASFSMSENHSILKWYLMLMSMLMFIISFNFGMINVVKFMDFPELQDLIGSTTYWFMILFGGIMLYLLIYILYIFFKSMAQAKKERIEY